MSYTNDNRERPAGGVLTRLFAIVGVAATAAIGGIGAMYATSDSAADCAARGHSTVLCAAGAVGLGEHQGDGEACGQEPFQRHAGKFRGAGKNDSHGCGCLVGALSRVGCQSRSRESRP